MLSNRRMKPGLLAALLALIVQLALGATVPQADLRLVAVADIAGAPICHAGDDGSAPATPAAPHAPDCLACPLCAAVHAPSLVLAPQAAVVPAPTAVLAVRPELPPPATAPPPFDWPPHQPRAPPARA